MASPLDEPWFMAVNSSSAAKASLRKSPKRPAKASLRGAVAEVFRRAILDSAEKVFRAEGFADAKMAKIAQQAGMAAGTLYNYFDSKESIFRALVDHRTDEFWTGLQAIAAQTDDVRERLRRITEATFDYMESHSPMCMVFDQPGSHSALAVRRACAPGVDRLRARFLRFYEDIFAEAARADLVRPQAPLDEVTLAFCGSIMGLLRGWMLAQRKGRLRDRAAFLVDLFLQGATPR
jgi:AcrR family transcriptional regulator